MNIIKRLSVLFFLIILSACESAADLINIEQYSKNGISFSIPGNWQVTADEEANNFRYIFVETPGEAIITISVYIQQDAIPLEEYVNSTVEELAANTDWASRDKGSIVNVGYTISGKHFAGYKNEFTMSLLSVKEPHIGEFFKIDSKTKAAYLANQAATNDLKKVKDGFALVLSTFNMQ